MGWLIGHLVGDYLLQNDWMAAGKKRSTLICLVHVAVYTASVMSCAGWWNRYDTNTILLAVAIPHFLIDRWGFVAWYMRIMGQREFMKPPMSPWSRIAVDNTMHLLCLYWLSLYSIWPYV